MTIEPPYDAPVSTRVTGRYVAFRVYSQEDGWWELNSFDIDWERAGER